MKKRTSNKHESFDLIRLHNYVKCHSQLNRKLQHPDHKRETPIKRERDIIELPRIFPLHNSLKQRHDLDTYFLHQRSLHTEIGVFNLKGTRCKNHKESPERGFLQDSTIDVEEKPKVLEKTTSAKETFLDKILSNNRISGVLLEMNTKLKVYIEEGNNSRLINELIRRRSQFRIVNKKQEANIVWTRFCDWEAADAPCKFNEIDEKQLHLRRKTQHLQPSGESLKELKKFKEIIITEFHMHNHLKNHYELSDKKSLFRNIKKYCVAQKIDEHEVIPKTFHLDGQKDSLPEIVGNDEKLWIVKPGEDTNRGTGITVEQGKIKIMLAVEQLIKSGKSALVQEYIEPLLFKGRKFDVRCYTLVTSFRGILKAYWYKEGYLRTCSKQFNHDPSNLYGHLTNDAIQKNCKDYGKYEQCNKLSFGDLELLLKNKDISYSVTLSRMKELARLSIKSAEAQLKAPKNMFAFQIFGYDFLLDQHGKVWLIEINTNPCLQFAGSLLSRIIWHMVENSLALAIDPLFKNMPQSYNAQQQKIDRIYEESKYQCIV